MTSLEKIAVYAGDFRWVHRVYCNARRGGYDPRLSGCPQEGVTVIPPPELEKIEVKWTGVRMYALTLPRDRPIPSWLERQYGVGPTVEQQLIWMAQPWWKKAYWSVFLWISRFYIQRCSVLGGCNYIVVCYRDRDLFSVYTWVLKALAVLKVGAAAFGITWWIIT